jgi:hypothetical protein
MVRIDNDGADIERKRMTIDRWALNAYWVLMAGLMTLVMAGCSEVSPVAPSTTSGGPTTLSAVEVMPVVETVTEPSGEATDSEADVPNRAPTVDAWCKELGDRIDVYARYADPDGDALTWWVLAKYTPEGTLDLQSDDGEVIHWSWYPAEGWYGDTWLRVEGADPSGASAFEIVDCSIPEPPPPPPGCVVDCEPPPPPPTCEDRGDCPPPPTCEDRGDCPPPPTCEELGTCPEPPCIVGDPPSSRELPNSSPTTELAFVREFCPDCVFLGKEDSGSGNSWTSDGDYTVVLIKAGRATYVFTEVERGDVLNVPKGVSHVSKFRCD